LLKEKSEGFASPVKFAANGIAGLPGQFANLLVAQLLIRNQQEKEPVLFRQAIQCFLNSLTEFGSFQETQRRFSLARRVIPKGIVNVRDHRTVMPGLE
jgi:hypothetical protein